MIKYFLLGMLMGIMACRPAATCPEPVKEDAGMVLQTPCAGTADGSACCFGSQAGTCRARECVAK